MRSLQACLFLLGALPCAFLARRAAASDDPDKARCVEAYEEGQRSRKHGAFLSSAEHLRYCASSACPQAMHSDCEQWLQEAEQATPTVVFQVLATHGESLSAATVAVDGGEARPLDGQALKVDPGEHVMVFEHPGFHALQRHFLLLEGSKLRLERVTLTPLVSPPAAPRASPPSGPPLASAIVERGSEARAASMLPLIASSAVALTGGVGFAFFGLRARSGEHDLAACSPSCSHDQVADVKRDYLFANLSLGLGVAGAVTGGILLVVNRAGTTGSNASAQSTLRLGPTTVWTTAF